MSTEMTKEEEIIKSVTDIGRFSALNRERRDSLIAKYAKSEKEYPNFARLLLNWAANTCVTDKTYMSFICKGEIENAYECPGWAICLCPKAKKVVKAIKLYNEYPI